MATIKQIVGAASTMSGSPTALNSLASGGFSSGVGTLTFATNDPIDAFLQVQLVAGSVSGNRQAIIYGKASLDGTLFESGPGNGGVGTTTTEGNLSLIGVLPLPEAGTHVGLFSVAPAFGGSVPHSLQPIIKNDSGAAFSSAGNFVMFAEITGDVT